ncbi:MAG: CoB--CoM heterodisulfide reductase subunit B [Candidatus Odinarchaeia archaeon]
MAQYLFFPGCMISYRYPQIEAASRKVLESLGVELLTSDNLSCCPDPVGIQSIDSYSWLVLAARNLSIGEEMGLDFFTICNGCFETLKSANTLLKNNERLKKRVNEILTAVNRKYVGKIKVKHMIEVLLKDVGINKIKQVIKYPLNGLKVAVHYGCHLLKPSNLMSFEDPERPKSLDMLVEALGAESVDYLYKEMCCGYGTSASDKSAALEMTRAKLIEIAKSKADCITLVCPSCFTQFDIGQLQVNRLFNESFKIPVLHYSQLLGLAMGYSAEELGIGLNRVKANQILEKIELIRG